MAITEDSLFEVDLFEANDSEVLDIHTLRNILGKAYKSEPGYIEYKETNPKEYAQFIKEFNNCKAEKVLHYAKDYGYVIKSKPGEVEDRNKRVVELKKIAPFAFDENNHLLPLEEQKNRQSEASAWGSKKYQNTPFIVVDNSSFLEIPELGDKAILLTRERIDHIIDHHAKDFTFENKLALFSNMKEELSNNVLTYQDDKKPENLCFVINKKSRNNNELIYVIKTNFLSNKIELNKVITLHGREDLFNRVKKTLNKKLHVYTNKRTGDWLAQQVSSYGTSPTCGTKKLLLDLYYKQNNIKNQGFSVFDEKNKYKKPQHDCIESNKNVGDGVVGRGIEEGR